MNQKWKCPKCGAENGGKDFVDGKPVCWKCGSVKSKREVFHSNLEETPPMNSGEDSFGDSGANAVKPEPHTIAVKDFKSLRPPGCALWLGCVVAVLVVLGIAICFMKCPKTGSATDDSQTVPRNDNGPKTEAGVLRYADGVHVSLYAPLDGYQPDSIARMGDVIYFTQEGKLYCLNAGEVSQIELDGWEADKVRVWKDEALVLTRPKPELVTYAKTEKGEEKEEVYFYTILRIYENSYADDDFLSERLIAGYENIADDITDFTVSPDGATLWHITRHRNATSADKDVEITDDGAVSAKAMDNTEYTLDSCPRRENSGRYDVEKRVSIVFEYMVSDKNSPRMAFDEDGNLYITGPEDAFIRILRKNTRALDTFAGQTMDMPGESDAIVGIHGQNDVGKVTFLCPTALTVSGGYLYVLDTGTVRRVPLGGVPTEGIDTLAGNITDNAQAVPAGASIPGEDALLATNERSDLIPLDDEGKILALNSPEKGVTYQISTIEG